MQTDFPFAEHTGLSETFLQDHFEALERGVIVFLGLWFLVYVLEKYFQYRLAKSAEENQPWTAFVPALTTLQWFQIGKISFWWLLLLLLPGIIRIFTSAAVASVVFFVVLLVLLVLWGGASFIIAKTYKQPPLFTGVLLCLPIVRSVGMYMCSMKREWPQWVYSLWGQILAIGISIVATGLFIFGAFYLFGWIAFGSLFPSFLIYLSSPAVTPEHMLDIFLQHSNS